MTGSDGSAAEFGVKCNAGGIAIISIRFRRRGMAERDRPGGEPL